MNCQNIIHKAIWKFLVDSQRYSEEKQMLVKVIEAKLSTWLFFVSIRQDTSIVNSEVSERLSLNRINLVLRATEIKQKALHEFLLQKCKEQTIKLTKKFRLKGNP